MTEKIIDRIVLQQYARAIKKECEKHENCMDCPLFCVYKQPLLKQPRCPFCNADNPTEWIVD